MPAWTYREGVLIAHCELCMCNTGDKQKAVRTEREGMGGQCSVMGT